MERKRERKKGERERGRGELSLTKKTTSSSSAIFMIWICLSVCLSLYTHTLEFQHGGDKTNCARLHVLSLGDQLEGDVPSQEEACGLWEAILLHHLLDCRELGAWHWLLSRDILVSCMPGASHVDAGTNHLLMNVQMMFFHHFCIVSCALVLVTHL